MSEADAPMRETIRPILTGHKALIVGIANDQSIAYGCAEAFRASGAAGSRQFSMLELMTRAMAPRVSSRTRLAR